MSRGYCAIGIYGSKTAANVGTLWRSAAIYGCAYIFTVGRRWPHQAGDTLKAWRSIPLFHFEDMDDLKAHQPKDSALVGIEQHVRAAKLTSSYTHLERAIYLLGAEDAGLPNEVIDRCSQVIEIPTPEPWCMNVAVAGSILLADRYGKLRP